MRFLASHRFVAWLVVLVGSVALNGGSSVYSAPVCALIDSTKDPAIALLETQLLADANTTWVERTEIDRLLAEQELQTAFAAEGITKRAALGRLLKADLLVLLRPAKNPDPNGPQLIDGVVCETKRGLRLRTLTVAKDKDAETTAKSLVEFVQQGLQKHAEKNTAVVAVPPFLSEDLGMELNYLQSAFAKVVEQRLLEQPGVLVVEMKEAQAIAKEIAITQTGATRLELTSPWYLIGRYRHDGQGAERRAKMSLRLLDGDQQVTLKGVKDLPPQELPAWITTKTGELLPLIQEGFKAESEFNPHAEARRLAERGQQFQKIGDWQQALEMYEASLLFDNEQQDVHRFAVIATTIVINSLVREPINVANNQQAFGLYTRGLEHAECYARMVKDSRRELGVSLVGNFLTFFVDSFGPSMQHIAGTMPASYYSTKQSERSLSYQRHDLRAQAGVQCSLTFQRIADLRAKAGIANDHLWAVLSVKTVTDRERYDLILDRATKWNALPDLPQRLAEMALPWQYRKFVGNDAREFENFLVKLEKIDRDDVRESCRIIRQQYEIRHPEIREIKVQHNDQETADFELVNLSCVAPPTSTRTFSVIDGTILLPKGDIFWQGRTLFRMEKPAILTTITKIEYPQQEFHIVNSVAFDGCFLWYATRTFSARGTGTLAAIELTSGRLHEFAFNDGVPNLANNRAEIMVSVISPGKVCVVGYTGHSWAGIAELSPSGDRKFNVFFEARETPDSLAEGAKKIPNSLSNQQACLPFRNQTQASHW